MNLLPTGQINLRFTNDVQNLVQSFLTGKKKTTIEAYKQDLQEFCIFLKIEDINAAAQTLLGCSAGEANALVLNYKTYLIDIQKLQSATVNRRLAALRSLVKLARTLGLVTWSLEIKNQEHRSYRDVRGVDSKDLKTIFEMLEKLKDKKAVRDLAILRLLFDLGLRRAEVCSLDLNDLDFQTQRIWILGKGHSQKEALHLPELTKAAIQRWLKLRGSHQGPLFYRLDKASDKNFNRLTGTGLYSIIHQLGLKAGLKSLTVHKFRHSAITNACEVIREQNLGIESVLKFSRHKSLNTALVYFDHLENQQGNLAELVSKKVK